MCPLLHVTDTHPAREHTWSRPQGHTPGSQVTIRAIVDWESKWSETGTFTPDGRGKETDTQTGPEVW